MRNLFRQFAKYYQDKDFRVFQNEFAKEVYECLGTSYSNNHNEVTMVTELCKTINGKSYDKLNFYAEKIHGTRSYVEFNKLDKPVTTELADMVIISVVTRNRDIVYEKLSFVQNKKSDESENWKIDDNQLYLLKNFPSFKGTKGIFKKNFGSDVNFLNRSKNLGTYGLFKQPGEMLLINADNIYSNMDKDKVKFDELRKIQNQPNSNNNIGFPFFDKHFLHHMDMFHLFENGVPFFNLPFLGNVSISQNIYEFIRNWSLYNIGEEASSFGVIMDQDLSNFTKLILRQANLGERINLNLDIQGSIETNLIVNVAHLELGEK